jgi:uncharacterized protein with PQ loop repeat
MVTKFNKVIAASWMRSIAFIMGIMCVFALAAWLLFAHLAAGSPVPHLLRIRLWLLVAEVVSLIFFFRAAWLMAVVGWFCIVLVFTGVFPWEEQGVQNLFYQFIFDIAFFVAGNLGLAARFLSNRPEMTTKRIEA